MALTLTDSAFHFGYKGHTFKVIFSHKVRKWAIYNGEHKLTEWPWNGTYTMPTGDDAQIVLIDYLKIEE